MFRVITPTPHCGFRTRWFSTREAAIRFFRGKEVAVMYDPAGERVF
jgi:hypothetical protein